MDRVENIEIDAEGGFPDVMSKNNIWDSETDALPSSLPAAVRNDFVRRRTRLIEEGYRAEETFLSGAAGHRASENQSVKTALAINMKSPTLSGAGREPKVIGTAFGLKEGQTSTLIIGNLGVYVVQTTKITPAEGLANYQAAANRIGVTKANAVNSVLYNALKEASEIEDNRAAFY